MKQKQNMLIHGSPVPNVFEVTKIHDRQAIIMEYVKGINASLNMYSNA